MTTPNGAPDQLPAATLQVRPRTVNESGILKGFKTAARVVVDQHFEKVQKDLFFELKKKNAEKDAKIDSLESKLLEVKKLYDNQAAKIDRLKAVIVGLKQDGKKALDEMMKSKNELKDQLNAKIEEMGDDCDKLANIFNQPGN